ncbi:MAG: hypothetical protein AUH85_05285 [Chloroflexi bacterium 13_1_40CM_4_68_4]|nr:MAG: hypothetical protein AUH85_05285 [Chloroflexi bacterium 13_1_40CM_4_68_4]
MRKYAASDSRTFDRQLVAAQPDLLEESARELDDLDVHRRLFRAEALDVPLPELPVAELLRALATEHRLVREEALRSRRLVQPRVEERTRDRRRRLGAQRQLALTAEAHLVHLLAHDVGGLTGRLDEDAPLLDHRRDDPQVAVSLGTRLHDGLERSERRRFFRKEVPRAAGRLEARHRRHDFTRYRRSRWIAGR